MIRAALLFWAAFFLYVSNEGAVQAQDELKALVVEVEPSASDLLSAFNGGDSTSELLEAYQLLIEQADTLTANLPPETCEGVQTAYHLVSEDVCKEESNEKYRRIDGACNNLNNPNWGKAQWPLRRIIPAAYADGIESPREHSSAPDETLPNSRDVSVKVATPAPYEGNDPKASMLLAIMGQFIDHDVTHAPQFDRECLDCSEEYSFSCSPISISPLDALYQNNLVCMDVPRTIGVPGHACIGVTDADDGSYLATTNQRQHLNSITAYLDASGVYGSDEEHLHKLQDGAKLKVNSTRAPDYLPYLPDDTEHHECRNTHGDTILCGLAGDERAAEQPTLTALHTIFVRLHNNIVDEMTLINSHWDEERMFKECKKIVEAILQDLIYSEYLPALLGPAATRTHKLAISPGRERVPPYDPSLSATISNVFAAAAYRLGHSQIPTELQTRDNDHTHKDAVPLINAFFNASIIYDDNTNRINGFVLGNIAQRVNVIDRHFTPAIHGNLFFEEDKGFGLDLLAINVQRGREHGIPTYVEYLEKCSPGRYAGPINSWDELTGVFQDEAILEDLKELYGGDDKDGVRQIDAFIGFVLEKHVPGGRVGHTLSCLLGDQFRRLRQGDRFWYERDTPEGFTLEQLNAIKAMTFSRLICDTLDQGDQLTIQPYALYTPECDDYKFPNAKPWAEYNMETRFPEYGTLGLPNFSNHRVSCSDEAQIPKLDLTPWKEEAPPSDTDPVDPVSYIGCFTDSKDRVLPRAFDSSDDGMTVERCIEHCRASNYVYAGLQWRRQCYCGTASDDYARLGELGEEKCQETCTGDETSFCGGTWAIAVYEI